MSILHPSAFAFLWAGLSLGGSIIAAPAKFQAPSLSMSVALEVGRAQFFWVGIGELVICACFLVSAFLSRSKKWHIVAIPVALFALQRVVVMPILDERTIRIIAGETVPPNHLHVAYIGLEVMKFIALLGGGFLAIASRHSAPLELSHDKKS